MNPGPVLVDERVRRALAYPDVCHREPEIDQLMLNVRQKVVAVCQGSEDHSAALLTGSGTAALEAALSSIVAPEGKLLVLENGRYGARLREIAAVHAIPHTTLVADWARELDLARLDELLSADDSLTHVAVAHHETSTGMLNPLARIGALVASHGRSLIVDAISSLGSERLDVVADHVDWCVGTANKNLEGLPGVSFVVARRSSFDALAGHAPRTYYLDLHGHYVAQVHDGAPLFTPAIQILFAFDRALDLMLEETVAARRARYASLAERVRRGLRARGATLLLPASSSSNAVTVATLPDGVTYADLHDGLKRRGFTIYAAPPELGPVFRVGTMGQLVPEHVDGFLNALDAVVEAAPRGAEAVA